VYFMVGRCEVGGLAIGAQAVRPLA
jgi:hypothetical protein